MHGMFCFTSLPSTSEQKRLVFTMLHLESAFIYNAIKPTWKTQTQPYVTTRIVFHYVFKKILTSGKNLKDNNKVSYIVSCRHGALFVRAHLPHLLNLL